MVTNKSEAVKKFLLRKQSQGATLTPEQLKLLGMSLGAHVDKHHVVKDVSTSELQAKEYFAETPSYATAAGRRKRGASIGDAMPLPKNKKQSKKQSVAQQKQKGKKQAQHAKQQKQQQQNGGSARLVSGGVGRVFPEPMPASSADVTFRINLPLDSVAQPSYANVVKTGPSKRKDAAAQAGRGRGRGGRGGGASRGKSPKPQGRVTPPATAPKGGANRGAKRGGKGAGRGAGRGAGQAARTPKNATPAPALTTTDKLRMSLASLASQKS